MPRLSIALLGTYTVLLEGQPVSFGYDKLRALLAYLTLEAAQPVHREKLAGLLWPDQSDQSAQDSLRQALSRLRQAIGDRQSDHPLLLIERETVHLPPSSEVWVDVQAFQDALARTSRHLHRHPQACETCDQLRRAACETYRGDFLANLSLPDSDLFEDWASAWRERLSQQAGEAFTQLIGYDEWKGDDARLQQDILNLLKLDPWNETGHAAWMKLLVRSGQRPEAVSHYQKVRQTLSDELGIEPSSDLTQVYEKIKGDSGEIYAQPVSPRVPGLPVPLTPLVGRRAELAELQAWLADPGRRLITVTGPGGVGKTRLVIAAVEQQASAFTDGAAFVSLVGAPEPSCPLAQRVAQTIQVVGPAVDFLGGKDFLLVLDGFETHLDDCPQVQAWLEASPRLVVLAASRQRLDLPGEWIFGLGGLEVPPPAMIADAEQYSAVNLFVRQAQQACAGFELGPQNRASISEICRLVDGFPLAINLAAAWAATIPCEQIAHEIRHSLDILSARTESQDIHRSVRAVFDQSWALLTEAERQVFPRLSVFRGGFDQPAALAVAGADRRNLTRLVEKSFLRGSPEGRYDLHDLLRQYGAEKLVEAGQTASIARQHFDYYFHTALQNQPGSQITPALQAFHWLVREQLNLQAALEWASACGESVSAKELARLMHTDFHGYGVHRLETQQLPPPNPDGQAGE
jgi:DNA-binding SARP family transcriptional activator/predicted ATPase